MASVFEEPTEVRSPSDGIDWPVQGPVGVCCSHGGSDFGTPGTSFEIGNGGTTGRNLSKEEAQGLALALCKGALVGLVRGLQVANQSYGPLSNIPDRLDVSHIVSYNGDDLRRAFIFGYEEDDVEEPTIQVLLRGLRRMQEF